MATKPEQIAFQSKIARASVLVRGMPFGFSVELYGSQRAENNVLSSGNAEDNPEQFWPTFQEEHGSTQLRRPPYFVRFLHNDRSVFSQIVPYSRPPAEGLDWPSKEGQGFTRVEFTVQALEERVLLRPSVA